MKTVSSLELLEPRIAPAGVVAVAYDAATGVLALTGDAAANEVRIFPTGAASHRIEGVAATTLAPSGLAVLDIGLLTRLTFIGGDSADILTLTGVRTLTALTFDGGAGADTLRAGDLVVKGSVSLSGGADFDGATFDGSTTLIAGNLDATDSANGMRVSFSSEKTALGGSLTFAGGTGSDALEVNGTTASFARGVSLSDAGGSFIAVFRPSDALSIGKLAAGASVRFTGGSGGNILAFSSASVALAGGLEMTGGSSADRIDFDGSSLVKVGKLATGHSIHFDAREGNDGVELGVADLRLAGGVEFLAGEGINNLALGADHGRVSVGRLAAGFSLRFTGGASADTIAAQGARVALAGAIDFAAGDGANALDINCLNGAVTIGKMPTGHSLRFTGGAGADVFGSEATLLSLAGGIEFAAGGGDNAMSFLGDGSTVALGKLASGQSLLFAGGAGNDTLEGTLARFTAAAGLELTTGAGVGLLDFDLGLGVFSVGRNLSGQSLLLNGVGGFLDIALDARRIVLAGSLESTDGDSGARSTIRGGTATSIGKNLAGVSFAVDGGSSFDFFRFVGSVTFAGSVAFEGSGGNDTFEARFGRFQVLGPFQFAGGGNDDNFTIDATTLLVASTFTVEGGAGAEQVSIVGDGAFARDVLLDLGTGSGLEAQSAALAGKSILPGALTVRGALTILGASISGSDDAITLTSLAVEKALAITLGAAASAVTIDNLRAASTFTLDAGDGADVIALERGDFFGNSTIARLATILAGAGDDQVLIGSALPAPNGGLTDSTRVRFLGGLTADGGTLTADTRNDITAENDFPTGAPTLAGFEVVVP